MNVDQFAKTGSGQTFEKLNMRRIAGHDPERCDSCVKSSCPAPVSASKRALVTPPERSGPCPTHADHSWCVHYLERSIDWCVSTGLDFRSEARARGCWDTCGRWHRCGGGRGAILRGAGVPPGASGEGGREEREPAVVKHTCQFCFSREPHVVLDLPCA